MNIAAVLLAAGRSVRFGPDDKLAALLNGLPLGFHTARSVKALPLVHFFAVVSTSNLDWPGFQILHNDRPEDGMGHSVAIGVAAARQVGAAAVLIALADMPFVPAAHFQRLLALHRSADARVASSDGARRMPPALFGSDWFGALEQSSGDRGARALLDGAELVRASARDLQDIDDRDGWVAATKGAD